MLYCCCTVLSVAAAGVAIAVAVAVAVAAVAVALAYQILGMQHAIDNWFAANNSKKTATTSRWQIFTIRSFVWISC